eukprot:scaffold3898_cov401-Prasinococcus_capsulatus_cf.AAC.7
MGPSSAPRRRARQSPHRRPSAAATSCVMRHWLLLSRAQPRRDGPLGRPPEGACVAGVHPVPGEGMSRGKLVSGLSRSARACTRSLAAAQPPPEPPERCTTPLAVSGPLLGAQPGLVSGPHARVRQQHAVVALPSAGVVGPPEA